MKVDEDAWSSGSQGPPAKVKEVETAVVLIAEQQSAREDSDQPSSSTDTEIVLPSRIVRKPWWLTKSLQEVEEQIGAPNTSFPVSHPPPKFLSYLTRMSSIIDAEPSSDEKAAGCHGGGQSHMMHGRSCLDHKGNHLFIPGGCTM